MLQLRAFILAPLPVRHVRHFSEERSSKSENMSAGRTITVRLINVFNFNLDLNQPKIFILLKLIYTRLNLFGYLNTYFRAPMLL